MKILWLSHLVPYPPKGGVLQRSYHLLRELSKYHDIDLMAFNQKDLISPLYNGDVEEGLIDSRKELEKICGKVFFFDIDCDSKPWGKSALAVKSVFSRFPYTLNWLRSSHFSNTLTDLLEKESYDLVHFDTISLDIFRPLVEPLPCVLDHHNIESHMLMRRARQERNLLKRAYFYQEGLRLRLYERKACQKYSGHITCSDIDAKRLRTITPLSSIKTIPNGVDTQFFQVKGLPKDKNTIVFVGTMSWYPNIEAAEFICEKIMPILRETCPGVKLQIIGARPPAQIKRYALAQEDIAVLGFVDDVREYIECASVYVCPIMDGGGTKLKVLDALAMSKPIVAHRVASEGIDVTNGVDIILADSPEEFAASIAWLMRSPLEMAKIGEAARTLAVEKYDYKGIGAGLSSYFEELAGK